MVTKRKDAYSCNCSEKRRNYYRTRLLASIDLYYLTTQILGYKDLTEKHKEICDLISHQNGIWFKKSQESGNLAKIGVHPCAEPVLKSRRVKDLFQEMANFKHDPIYQRLWLIFRSGFKTTIISKAHTIQCMLIYPDIRILLAHNKLANAQAMLREIKVHFLQNDDFRKLFSEYCAKRKYGGKIEWGTSEQVTLPNRSGKLATQEPTIDTMGVDTLKTGMHYDLQKRDDLVTHLSVTNADQIESSILGDAAMQQLFDRPTEGFVDRIGTPYHFADLYAKLQPEEIRQETNGYWRLQSSSIYKLPVQDEEGNFSIPELIDQDGLDRLRALPTMDPYTLNSQYFLVPISAEDRIFKDEWFRTKPDYPQNCIFYITVDPATSKRKTSDYTVILVHAIDYDGFKYTIDGIRDKLDHHERIEAVIHFVKKYEKNLVMVLYEAVGFQESDAVALRQAMREDNCERRVEPIKCGNHSKTDRVARLVNPYANGTWFWKEQIIYRSKFDFKVRNLTDEARYEAMTWTRSGVKGNHDDILDCQSQLLDPDLSIGKGTIAIPERVPGKSTLKDLKRLSKEIRHFHMAGIHCTESLTV